MKNAMFEDTEAAPVEDTRERYHWSSHAKFMLQAIGANEGLGNICRFPGYFANNGNVTFLVPYLLLKIFFGIPLTYMMLALGQYSEKGPLDVWMLCPLSEGIGYMILVLTCYTLIMCNTWVTYSLFYFFSSFQSNLPWFHCDHTWATETCMVRSKNATTTASCIKQYNFTVCNEYKWQLSCQHFWMVRVLGYKAGDDITVDGVGEFRIGLILCLALSCFLIFVVVARGLRPMEKIMTIATVYPFFGLAILIFASFLNVGSGKGLGYLLNGNMTVLVTKEAWVSAYEMVTSSSNLGIGVLITLGSYCDFRNPVNMDAIILNIVDILTGVGCVIFSFNCIGIISYHYGLHPLGVLQYGYNIAFVLVPEALEFIPGASSFWSLLYFSSIFCFGMTTQFVMMASILSIIYDRFPRTMTYPVLVSGGACLLLFLLGLPLCTNNGTHFASSMEVFVDGVFPAIMITVQVFVVLWVYAFARFSDDVHFMLGFRPSNFFQGCWLLAPLYSLAATVWVYISTPERLNIKNPNIELICWSLCVNIPLCVIILVGIVNVLRFSAKKKLRQVMKPDPHFGPNDPVLMKSRRMFSAQAMTKEYMYRQSRLGAHTRNQMQSTSSDTGSIE